MTLSSKERTSLNRKRYAVTTTTTMLLALVSLRVVPCRAFTATTTTTRRGGFLLPSLQQLPPSPPSPPPRLFSSPSPFSSRSRTWLSSTTVTEEEKARLESLIKAKGEEIRALKESGADKAALAPLVEQLLDLKAQADPEEAAKQAQKKQKKKQQNQQKPTQKQKKQQQKQKQKQQTATTEEESDLITSRSENYSKWYNDLVRVAGLAEGSPVRGCMVIKPWGMSLWDAVRRDLDERIREQGAENAYFPLLVPQSFLCKEAEHVEGFAKECAVVTHHRLAADDDGKLVADPGAKLEEPLVIRPTSETVIWSTFKKWINSHRDLPLKINQWANVLRWELRTRPFLRTSEFLWQEGHTAHATAEEASAEARTMMGVYADMCRETLALPTIRGVKSPSERFAGADETYTIEALMANGWALQSGTSHFLGRNFAKAFDATFTDENGGESLVWGTSWGVSTRLLGALVMTHSDDAGLVLPPKVAPKQVVVVPIPGKAGTDDEKRVKDAVDELTKALSKTHGLRVQVDDRDYVRNGAKYFEWERKGVPLRIEIGPRDVKNGSCVFKYRTGTGSPGDDNEKVVVNLDDAAREAVDGLDRMQFRLYETAEERLKRGVTTGATYEEMKTVLEKDEAGVYPGAGLYLVPWKCDAVNEDKIKEECKATIRCYPLKENEEGMAKGKKCFYSGEDATHMAVFGRAF